jgi:hypothetical protein
MSRRRLLLVVLAVLTTGAVAAGMAAAAQGNGNNNTFEYAIGLWGDMPYSDTQAQTGVPNLMADMNNSDLAFSVQDGDLKAGRGTPGSATPTTCVTATPPAYTQVLGYFNALNQPAIFTPGDNDWTDCDRAENGAFKRHGEAPARALAVLLHPPVLGTEDDVARAADGTALPRLGLPDQ